MPGNCINLSEMLFLIRFIEVRLIAAIQFVYSVDETL